MKKILLAALFGCLAYTLAAQPASLETQFRRPTGDARPWTLWYWMYGAVSDEGLRADLEAMASAGLGGAYLVTIRSSDDPRGKAYGGEADQLTETWWRRIRTAFTEADRLGLQLGVHICDGFALAGGPWNTPAESMQRVVSADTVIRVNRPTPFLLRLPEPERNHGYYEDIALVAMPVKGGATMTLSEEGRTVVTRRAQCAGKVASGYALDERHDPVAEPAHDDEPTLVPTLSCENLDPAAAEKNRVSIDAAGTIRAGAPCRIDYAFAEPVTCRNVEIVLGGNNYQAHRLTLSASDDGCSFRFVKRLTPARHGWQNTDFQTTHAIPPTTARIFRFEWTPDGSEAGSEDLDAAKWKPNLKIKQIRLRATPRIHQWEGKAGLVWRVAEATGTEELTAEDCVRLDEVIDLTATIEDGCARVQLPEGRWRILRLGHTTTGHTNATGGAGRGLECDKFDRRAVGKQIDNWFGRIRAAVDPEVVSRVLKVLYVDSWECGSQNWSPHFADEFRARRGYELRPWLPLLAGVPMESAARSEEVLRDVRTTIAELVHDIFFDVLARKADEYGCRFTAESVAPTMVSDGMLHYDKVDLPMGEFWLDSPTHDKPNDMADAVSGARIYGKRIVSAEGFTELRGVWDETPARLKPLLDRNYAAGLNRLVYHVMTHNPWLDRRPGMTLDGIGLFFQRDNTWFRHGARALSDYAARCQALLQYGVPVVDIAVFTGEEMPRRSILPDRLVPSLPGLFGAERLAAERERLANAGQPLRVQPVGVTHSANMADPDRWIDPLRGYAYDSFNRDALLRLARAEGGRMVLPGGASYRVLVIPAARPMNPETPMSDEVRAKIDELRRAGVAVPEIPYVGEDLTAFGLERDAVVPADVAWTHRRSEEEGTDIYFFSNRRAEARTVAVSLRTAGRVPELWDPLTGRIADAGRWSVAAGRTEVELPLEADGSLFVVFRRAGSPAAAPERAPRIGTTPLDALRTGDWWITFDLGSEGVRTERSAALFDWSQSDDMRLRYYSGTATCRTAFRLKARPKRGRVMLELDGVHDVAAVAVNGRPCGVAWTAPYEVDITEAVRKGENTLVIEVSNTWANALLGAAQGKAPFRGIWTNAPYRRQPETLLPAGLTGEVRVRTER